jgi:hypothetical protein
VHTLRIPRNTDESMIPRVRPWELLDALLISTGFTSRGWVACGQTTASSIAFTGRAFTLLLAPPRSPWE